MAAAQGDREEAKNLEIMIHQSHAAGVAQLLEILDHLTELIMMKGCTRTVSDLTVAQFLGPKLLELAAIALLAT